MSQWIRIPEFPNYSVNYQGEVRNDSTGRVVQPYVLGSGHLTIGLFHEKTRYTRSLAKIVASAFVPRPQFHFDTPICLDGDLVNCHADNLVWRPRWFAVKYARQFRLDLSKHAPIRNRSTGQVFDDVWPLVVTQGLLYNDIILAASNNTYVFPTMEFYEWAD